MSEINITKNNFETEVLRSDKPVLLDFRADWCGPCRMLAPVLAEIASESDGSFKVGLVNIDEEPELASAFNIANIPTLVVMSEGKTVNVAVGYREKDEILALLQI